MCDFVDIFIVSFSSALVDIVINTVLESSSLASVWYLQPVSEKTSHSSHVTTTPALAPEGDREVGVAFFCCGFIATTCQTKR